MKPHLNSALTRTVLVMMAALPVLLATSPATPAAASPPTRETIPYGTFTLAGVCSFDVQVTSPQNREYLTTFYNRNGEVTTQLVTGDLHVTLTNLSTGYATTLNIPGPARYVYNPDGSVEMTGGGPSVWLGDVNTLLSWPSLALVSGNLRVDFDSNFEVTGASWQGGTVTDLCAALSH
jgi:hypothetical protein